MKASNAPQNEESLTDPLCLRQYNVRNSQAFKRMEEIACRLVLENQELNLTAHTKVFKDKVQTAVKEHNAAVLSRFGLKEVPRPQEVSKYDLRVQYEKYRTALEAETRRCDAIAQKLESTTQEYLSREVELNTLIYQQSRLLA